MDERVRAALAQVRSSTPSAEIASLVDRVDAENARLEGVEAEAFALLRGGQRGAALARIEASDYANGRDTLEATADRILRLLQRDEEGLVETQRSRSVLVLVFAVLALPAMGVSWLAVLRRTRRHLIERRRAEDALRNSEERYRAVFDAHPLPMWVYDRESLGILAANRAAVLHYGYSREELEGMTLRELRRADDVPKLLELLDRLGSAAGPQTNPCRHRKKDGTLIDVEVTGCGLEFDGRPARVVAVNDVTDRLRLEEQLRQSQKMDAVGRLAGGVAHDFNNVLNVIMGYGDLLLRDPAVDASRRARVEQIRKAADRAASLTRQLLAFSRKQVVQRRPLDLNVVVGEMEKMLRRLIGEDVALVFQPHPNLGRVRADVGQIEQVLMNLVVNARDAMPEGGTITVETWSDERSVLLAVADTGYGMTDDVRARIFEPFFTTKPPGNGTGLGLSTVYAIVEQSGGRIEVESKPGKGSTFRIHLPLEAASAADAPAAEEPASGAGETILVVEDEPVLREVIGENLRDRGYRVLEATGADEAISVFGGEAESVRLLLTDVVMPGVDGRNLADGLRLLKPGLKVLFMSGYTGDVLGRHLGPDDALIEKPFVVDELMRKVRACLDAAPSLGGERAAASVAPSAA
jgi:PAS domain S-box-containing protein